MFSLAPSALDLAVSHALQQFQPAWLTAVLKFMTATFSPEVLLFVGLLLAIVAFNRHRPSRAAMIVVLDAGNLLTLLLKHFFDRPRPSPTLVHVLVHEADSSFPSGHAIAMMLMVTIVLTFLWRRTSVAVRWAYGLSTLVLAVIVGYSRVYLGVHWLSDVLAGYCVALVWAGICYAIVWPLVRGQKRIAWIS